MTNPHARPWTPTSSWSAPAPAALPTAVTAAYPACGSSSSRRADVCGGATAWSGGWMWAPGNPLARADGVVEDVEQFRTYLRARARRRLRRGPGRRVPRRRAGDGAVLPRAHRADVRPRRADLRRLRRPARRGHRGRSVAPAPVDGRALGADVVATAAPPAVRDVVPRHGRSWPGRTSRRSCPPPAATSAACCTPPAGVARHVYDLVTRRRGMQLVNGTALVGRLLRSALDLGVDVRVVVARSPRCSREDGRVTAGSSRRRRPGRSRSRAARGVVLAAGGFPHDVTRRRALFPAPRRAPSTGRWHPPTADGAGTALGESAGGRLRTDLASPAAWCPVSLVPYRVGPRRARSRTSWTAPSPAASACSPPAGAS